MNTEEKFKVGIYLRLSREDEEDKDESASISNQRNYIMEYIRKYDNLMLVDEYIDDGYSGNTIDRPNFQRLLNDIENKKINCIIVKDQSRFGRFDNASYYINTLFAIKRIRFIAPLDYIDTFDENSFGNRMIGYKAVSNNQYCMDTSYNVKGIIYSKKRRGLHLGGTALYGYKKDPNNKYHLIIDEEVAPIVRRIFEMFASGNSLHMIAKTLDEEHIPIPSEYKGLNRGQKSSMYGHWQTRTIGEMLKNETYIGNLCQCTRKKVSVSAKLLVRNPKEKWIIVPNTHDPIIDKETFNIVQQIFEKNSHITKNTHNYLFKGFIYCKECGHTIGINTRNNVGYCVCNYYRKYSKENACTPHRIKYEILEKQVLKEIKTLFKMVNSSNFSDKIKQNNKIEKRIIALEKENTKLKIEIEKAQDKDDNAYMDKINGLISFETYMNCHNKIIDETVQNKNKLEENIKIIEDLKNNTINRDYENIVNEYLSLKRPNRKILSSIIDKIVLDENLNIEIYYRFKRPI